MTNPQMALVVVGILALGGFLYYQASQPDDPLRSAESGVAASLVVHAALIDDATGGPASSASVQFKPTKLSAGSIAPASLGTAFMPLCTVGTPGYADCVVGERPYYGSAGVGGVCDPSLRAMSNWIATSQIVGGTRQRIDGVVYVGRPVQYWPPSNGFVNDANVQIYSDGKYAGAVRNTDSTGIYSFPDVAIQPGMTLNTIAAKSGWCPAKSNVLQAPGSTGFPSSTCIVVNEPYFAAWLRANNRDPNCISQGELGMLYSQYLNAPSYGGSQSGGQGNVVDTGTSMVRIPVTIAGTVTTKNLATPVKLEGEVKITTAAGKVITRALPTANVPQQGGKIDNFATTLDLPKSDVGTGRTTITVSVSASAQDFEGASRSDRGDVTLYADTDYRGSVSIKISAASFATTIRLPDGTTETRTRNLAPVSARPGFMGG